MAGVRRKILSLLCAFSWCTAVTRATETEHLGIRVLPAAQSVTIDGKTDDWNLVAGVFVCGDVEAQRGRCAAWFHAMWDSKNLYILARWVDETPMNNPGSIKGSAGFQGDCLQFRVITGSGEAAERVSHWTCWRDADGLDIATGEYGKKFNEGRADIKAAGGAQAFAVDADQQGYAQELAIPWSLITLDGKAPVPGEHIRITVELNFTIAGNGRLTIKDIFKAGVVPNRVFTFSDSTCWGTGTIERENAVDATPVRLSDTREFVVRMEDGAPKVDWTGLVASNLPKGFKPIRFTVPADGYVSLNLFAPDGTVARQLLNCVYFAKGEHEVMWDGLGTPSYKQPADPVPEGAYRWEGIFHTGLGLRLRGWAAAGNLPPWEGWGGDHGNPVSVASDDERTYLGWNGGEGSKPLMAIDPAGNVLWRNIRGGIADARFVATDGQTVYVFNSKGRFAPVSIYRLDARTGRYTEWSASGSTDLPLKSLIGEAAEKIAQPSGLSAGGGKVFASISSLDAVLVINAESGELVKRLNVPAPTAIHSRDGKQLLIVSRGAEVLAVDVESGIATSFVRPELAGKSWISAVTSDRAGNVYVGIREGDSQVLVYARDGKLVRTIGRNGGRPLQGPWRPDGMIDISAIAVDTAGKLWVMEDNGSPRRVSVWNAAGGEFVTEYLGPTGYGAQGGAINPVDPNLMVGQGIEWRIDPTTGRSRPVQTITTRTMSNSRFGFGPNNRLYLATTNDAIHGINPVWIYERKGDAEYRLRTVIRHEARGEGKEKQRIAIVWADRNDDSQEQPDEVREWPLPEGYAGWITGWYMPMTGDLTFYGSQYQLKVSGWTSCGAPEYDFGNLVEMPAPSALKGRGGMGAQKGHGSADNRLMLYNGEYGLDHSTFDCFDIVAGKKLWSYPNNFTGVHGSHRAPGPVGGLIRGAYDVVGSVRLPEPIGNLWVVPSNKGEWHLLTQRGYYLSPLFQSDPMKWAWPDKAVPGAILDDVPPGAGEEAFGGSVTQGVDGNVYIQCGHTSFWNLEVTGLDSVRPLSAGGGEVRISEADLAVAKEFRSGYLQAAVGLKRLIVSRATPQFTGRMDVDFKGAEIASFKKNDGAAIRSAVSWDDHYLYVAWEVRDDTPWLNAADAPEYLYARGDTVDLQLGTNLTPQKEAALGDLRLSIGPFQGRPTAVLYRKVTDGRKNPKAFHSGVVANYSMDSVTVIDDAKIEVAVDQARRLYVVEAAIPFSALGIQPKAGLTLRGDLGATHSDKAGADTALRTYWSNQDAGIVSDEVFELQMAPQNWGEFHFYP